MSRVAVVTGAAAGIGAATCDRLESSGWEVVAVDREPSGRRHSIQVDLSDHSAVEDALSGLARVDGLVNNAAVQLFKPLGEISVGEWDEVLATNLRSVFVCLTALHDRLAASSGSVVNVCSVHAHATSGGTSAYAASKGGVLAFTRSAALDLAEYGVRVNAVTPGAIDTNALRAGLSRQPSGLEALVARTPLRRIGRPDEVAEAIDFLLDSSRSGFVTGQELVVDGGALARLGTE